MIQLSLPKESRKASTESVKFTDGMLVTADDLNAGMQYPLGVLQVLVRSYFGCGIVCGLELDSGQRPPGAPQGQPAPSGQYGQAPDPAAAATPHQPNFILEVKPGVALDCEGFPIELCDSIKLDLTPDPCVAGTLGEDFRMERCIAVRRTTSDEQPKTGCGCCGSGETTQAQCSRVVDHVLVQAFQPDKLPSGICRAPEKPAATGPAPTAPPEKPQSLCDCMKTRPVCDRCGEGWVLLGCVLITKSGIAKVDAEARQYVKPVACLCTSGRRSDDSIAALTEKLRALETKVAALAAGQGKTAGGETVRSEAMVSAPGAETAEPDQTGTSAPPASEAADEPAAKPAPKPRPQSKKKAEPPADAPPPPPPQASKES